ncbi:MAG: redoxin family protein [Chryseolinea sp.]
MENPFRRHLLSALLVLFGVHANYGQAPAGGPTQAASDAHPTLQIGATAPDFNLKGVDGKKYTLASFKSAKVLVIAWMSNHCPTAQAYEDRLMKFTKDYAKKGVAVVAIMPNDPKSVSLSELGYTDYGDSYEEMQWRAKDKGFNYPYLYDGDTETAAKAYGPVATPHLMVFDKDRKLVYSGRFDDVEKPTKTPTTHDLINATEEVLAGKPVTVATTKVFGCSTKWAEKADWRAKAEAQWAKEPVTISEIDVDGILELKKNNTNKLILINVWATWCGPCVAEYHEFIDMYRMYRRRPFQFISISADDPTKKEGALDFLKESYSSVPNYIFSLEDKYKLIEAIDPNWNGALPYTMLIEPGGKLIYSHDGTIDPYKIKKLIADNPTVGRYF